MGVCGEQLQVASGAPVMDERPLLGEERADSVRV